jgi:hypothetical protein
MVLHAKVCGSPSTALGCLQRKATLRKQRGLFRFGTDICNKSASPLLWRTWKKASELYSSPGEIPQCQEVAPEAEDMCIICERELWGEHRALEREFFKSCKTCKKFPGTSSEGTCYHCFAVGNTIEKCPECGGQPWSQEFLEAKAEIESPDDALLPF